MLTASAAVLLAGLTWTAPSFAADADPVIARVNGGEIHESDIKLAEDELGPSLPPQMDPATRRENIINYLIDMKAVAKAADDRKLGDSDDFKRHLEFTRQRLLMDTLLNVESKAAAEAFYKNDPFWQAGLRKSVTVSHWAKAFWSPSFADVMTRIGVG